MSEIEFVLQKTLDEIGMTKNQLSVLGPIRSNTVGEIANGTAKAIKIDTLLKILDTLNEFAEKNGFRKITESDIIKYVSDNNDKKTPE